MIACLFARLRGLDDMTPQEFQRFYPLLIDWLRTTLMAHAGIARTVASCAFPRLPFYFAADTLAFAKVVLVDQLPIPPLTSWGLTRFAEFEGRNFDGIAYLDTFFLKQAQSRNEAIHFHELIHLVQWRISGAGKLFTGICRQLGAFWISTKSIGRDGIRRRSGIRRREDGGGEVATLETHAPQLVGRVAAAFKLSPNRSRHVR